MLDVEANDTSRSQGRDTSIGHMTIDGCVAEMHADVVQLLIASVYMDKAHDNNDDHEA